jgi:cytochrome P450
VIYHLLKNQEIYFELVQELDDAAAAGQLSNPVKHAEAIKLPLMCACIKEAMRLHPSVGFTMPRIVPAGGITIDGQRIPAGYRVGINPAVLHYNKDIFGQDADRYNPKRWLGSGATLGMDKYMIQFGAGTRTCIGKNVSYRCPHMQRRTFISIWKTNVLKDIAERAA